MICPKCKSNINDNIEYCPKCNEKNFGIYSYEYWKQDIYAAVKTTALLINSNFLSFFISLSNIFEYYDNQPKNKKNQVSFFDDILNFIYQVDLESLKSDLEFDSIYSIYNNNGKERNKTIDKIAEYNNATKYLSKYKVNEIEFSNKISQDVYQLLSHEFSNDYNNIISIILSIRSKKYLVDSIMQNAKKSGFIKNIFNLFKGVIAGAALNVNPFIGIPQLLIMYIGDKNERNKTEQLLDTLSNELCQINNLVDKINNKRIKFSEKISKYIMEVDNYDVINIELQKLISDDEISCIYLNDIIDGLKDIYDKSNEEDKEMFKYVLLPALFDNNPSEVCKYYIKKIFDI